MFIRIDAAGECPVVVDDDEDLRSNDGARWRFVAQVETRMDGHAIAQAWLRQSKVHEGPAPTTGRPPFQTLLPSYPNDDSKLCRAAAD